MKWSPILHGIAAFTGIFGLLALLSAWIAEINGSGVFLGFSEEHLFNDAKTLFLASIAFGIGVLIHRGELNDKV